MNRRCQAGWLVCLMGVASLAAGCTPRGDSPAAGGTAEGGPSAPANQSPATSGNLAIEFRSDPDPPKTGDNVFEVTVTQADGTPVTDAAVTTVFSMPAMPAMNMPAMRSSATLVHDTTGRYRGTGQLSMGGTWNVTVTVSRGSEELGRKSFSVIAK